MDPNGINGIIVAVLSGISAIAAGYLFPAIPNAIGGFFANMATEILRRGRHSRQQENEHIPGAVGKPGGPEFEPKKPEIMPIVPQQMIQPIASAYFKPKGQIFSDAQKLINREEYRKLLDKWHASNSPLVIIEGDSGFGKTTLLAKSLVERYASDFDKVTWLSCSWTDHTTLSIEEFMSHLAAKFGDKELGQPDSKSSYDAKVRALTHHLDNFNQLVIIDGYEKLGDEFQKAIGKIANPNSRIFVLSYPLPVAERQRKLETSVRAEVLHLGGLLEDMSGQTLSENDVLDLTKTFLRNRGWPEIELGKIDQELVKEIVRISNKGQPIWLECLKGAGTVDKLKDWLAHLGQRPSLPELLSENFEGFNQTEPQNLVLAASIFRREFSREALQAVFGQATPVFDETLHKTIGSVFLSYRASDKGAILFHPMHQFAQDFCDKKLGTMQDVRKEYHLRAGKFYAEMVSSNADEQFQNRLDAIYHLKEAGDSSAIAKIVIDVANTLVDYGQLTYLMELIIVARKNSKQDQLTNDRLKFFEARIAQSLYIRQHSTADVSKDINLQKAKTYFQALTNSIDRDIGAQSCRYLVWIYRDLLQFDKAIKYAGRSAKLIEQQCRKKNEWTRNEIVYPFMDMAQCWSEWDYREPGKAQKGISSFRNTWQKNRNPVMRAGGLLAEARLVQYRLWAHRYGTPEANAVIVVAQESLKLYANLGNTAGLKQALHALGVACYYAHKPDALESSIKDLNRLSETVQAEVLFEIAGLYADEDEWSSAILMLSRSLDLYKQLRRSLNEIAWVKGFLAICYFRTGDYENAQQVLEETYGIHTRTRYHNLGGEAFCLGNLAKIQYERGVWDQCEELYQRWESVKRIEAGALDGPWKPTPGDEVTWMRWMKANLLYERNSLHEAKLEFETCLEEFSVLKDERSRDMTTSHVLVDLSRLMALEGLKDKAKTLSDEGVDKIRSKLDYRGRPAMAYALRRQGETLRILNQYAEAIQKFEESMKFDIQVEGQKGIADSLHQQALCYERLDDIGRSYQCMAKAKAKFEKMQISPSYRQWQSDWKRIRTEYDEGLANNG